MSAIPVAVPAPATKAEGLLKPAESKQAAALSLVAEEGKDTGAAAAEPTDAFGPAVKVSLSPEAQSLLTANASQEQAPAAGVSAAEA